MKKLAFALSAVLFCISTFADPFKVCGLSIGADVVKKRTISKPVYREDRCTINRYGCPILVNREVYDVPIRPRFRLFKSAECSARSTDGVLECVTLAADLPAKSTEADAMREFNELRSIVNEKYACQMSDAPLAVGYRSVSFNKSCICSLENGIVISLGFYSFEEKQKNSLVKPRTRYKVVLRFEGKDLVSSAPVSVEHSKSASSQSRADSLRALD